ncbi:phage shock protein operon transcriptional activator [Aliikangiella maris]|uniref:Phage shock protein operon transcriptional activator n=2 Tax=Aliikangiella maris TaxID=3162458 RepID=A0ABV3MMM2_9GAMM
MNRNQDNLIGEAVSFLEVIEQVSLLAPIDKPVLIVGERGTGKELIASRLHYLSSRWDQPFIKLNCAAINENLLETELFGHESGSFTGANKRHLGRFEIANKGTLFLDELGNSSLSVQEKLLRVIEYGEMERVGGNKTIKVDVRIVAATNENLPQLAQQGKFRADLLDRLAFDVITIPPLRARVSDILILAQHFGLAMTRELERDYFAGFTKNAEQALLTYDWPGNVRELKNVVERNIYKSLPDHPIDQIQFDPFASPYQLSGEGKPIAGYQANQFDGLHHYAKDTPNYNRHNFAESNADNNNSSKHNALTSSNQPESDSDSHKDLSIESNQQTTLIKNDHFDFPLDLKQYMADKEVSIIQDALKQAQFNQKKCAELLGLTYHQLRGYLKKYQLLDSK